MSEMNSASLLFVFVRNGVESTLERTPAARAHLGQLMHQLIKAGTLPPAQYYKGWVYTAAATGPSTPVGTGVNE